MRLPSIRLFRPADLLPGVILLGGIYLLFFWFKPQENADPVAYIQIDNHLAYQVDLRQDQILKLNEFNPPVEVEVRNQSIGIIRNDCVQKVCIKMGFVSHSGEMIVCVPKKILIFIPSQHQNHEINAVTG